MKTKKQSYSRREAFARVLKIGLPVLFASGISVYFRITQLAVFLAASAIRSSITRPSKLVPGAKTEVWAQLTPPNNSRVSVASRAVITYHPWYQNFHTSQVSQCLSEISALGVTYVRSDVRWSDVIPDGQQPDEMAFRWYREYFEVAYNQYGLEPFVVLSNPPASVKELRPEPLLAAWNHYVEQVVLHLGDICSIYQVLNEPNNPVYSIFGGDRVADAINSASLLIRSMVSHPQIVINVIVDLWNWQETIDNLLKCAGHSIDVIGLDHYPGTWTTTSESDWAGIEEIAAQAQQGVPGSIWKGKTLAILETGYSTNVRWFRNYQRQSDFFQHFQAFLRDIEIRYQKPVFAFVGFYELTDAATDAPLDPEAHFGLLTSELERKPAFGVVQAICATLK